QVVPMPPGKIERRVRTRMIRQEVLTARNPPLELSVVIDEAVLLRKVGSGKVMAGQLRHLTEMGRLPNVDLRILPLGGEASLMADSFVVFGFSPEHETSKLGDVVMTEGIESSFYVEGETDTYNFRRFFQAVVEASKSPGDSGALLLEIAERHWKQLR
ncbi:MAG: DUF5753 domain-containing protein, partial [Trebonia sp.]|uniref:DUF5753 domain-containing protein n=1 Tax=Trebonia sp. TaxID=2767075 RepID=UPI003BB1CBB3